MTIIKNSEVYPTPAILGCEVMSSIYLKACGAYQTWQEFLNLAIKQNILFKMNQASGYTKSVTSEWDKAACLPYVNDARE